MRPPTSFRVLVLALALLVAAIHPAAAQPPPRFTAKKFATVAGRRMAYVEVGTGDPIVFLHGNPTSSFLWRNVMPALEGRGRLIAPDLIGMGDSDKLPPGDPLRYSFFQHANFLYQLLEQLDVKENVTLVIHDWGSVLGFQWAFYNRFNPNAVKGIAFMESLVAPVSLDDFPSLTDLFALLRSPAGEKAILQNNFYIETGLPDGILRNLTKEEFDEYRRPFLNPGEDRRPTLTWMRQFPLDEEPADVGRAVAAYSQWLGTSSVPKLFVRAEPGLILVGSFVNVARSWPNVTEVVVPGIHFMQEDSPDEIGKAIADWLP